MTERTLFLRIGWPRKKSVRLSAVAELCSCFGLSMDRCLDVMRPSSTLALD